MEIALARIRVLVANQPRLMRDLIAFTIADQKDVEIIGQIEDVAELPDRVEETRPDCVIISLEKPGKRPNVCDALLEQYPHIKILAITSESNTSFLYWTSLEIHSSCGFESSEEGLLNALRGKIDSKES
jgi:DNA-binding NarL/FixJ family response regulator